MKKIIALLLAVSMIFVVAACGQSDVASSDEGKEVETKLDAIKEKGKLVIGTSAAYPPYEFHKEIDGKDTIVGFDIDIAKEIANDLGVELEIKDMQFAGLLAALEAEKIDIVIAGMTPTEERKKSFDFSKVYYVAKQGIVVNAEDADKYKTLEDIKDKKIGVQKGTIQEGIAKDNFEEKNILGLGKVSDVMLQVMQGKVDAAMAEAPVAKAYAQQNDKLFLSEVEIDTGDSGSAIAIKKGNEVLVETINKSLDKLIESGKIDEFVINATKIANEK